MLNFKNLIKNKTILKSLVGLCTSTLMIVFTIFVFLDSTLGWFSENDDVTANGMSVISDAFEISVNYSYSYVKSDDPNDYIDFVIINPDDPNDITLEDVFIDLVPGKTVYIRAEYISKENSNYTGETHFVPVSEIPFIEHEHTTCPACGKCTATDCTSLVETDKCTGELQGCTPNSGNVNKYYYLGSQLYISSVWVDDVLQTDSNDINPADKFFLPYTKEDENATEPFLCFTKQVEADKTSICDNFIVPANGTTIVEFAVTFVYLEKNQNNYKYQYFSVAGGECFRYIYTSFS